MDAGYAMSTDAELRTTLEVTQQTGIVFDPVYSGGVMLAYCWLLTSLSAALATHAAGSHV